MAFYNGSIYDYHFIIKELAKESEGEYNCPGKNTEKYKTFSVPITKEATRVDKNGNKIKITHLTNNNLLIVQDLRQGHYQILVDNLAERIHKIKCKHGHHNKNVKRVELNTKIVDAVFDTQTLNVKDGLILYKCLNFNRNDKKTFDEKLNGEIW